MQRQRTKRETNWASDYGSENKQAPLERIAAAVEVIPNEEVPWEEWNNLGMAIWRATGGSGKGFAVFDDWSRKSNKYNAAKTAEKWKKFFTSSPKEIGAGTIFYLANEADPDWEKQVDEVESNTDNISNDPEADGPLQWTDENADRIKDALSKIPLDHRNEDIGKALNSLHWWDDYYDWGLDAWDNWSKWGEAYQGFKDLQARWQLFNRKDGSKIATLFEIAREHGWKDNKATKKKLLQTSAVFVEGYVPPDYLIDGLLQRRYVYSLTAPTGSGKTAVALRIAIHVALGLELAGREVEKGRVLFFAGENPDDVRSRWIKLCEVMGKKPEEVDVFFMPFTPKLAEKKIRKQIDDEAAEHGPFSLLIVDTSASYYTGDDENDNVALGNHARMLRTFVDLPGGPTILVTCHPTKSANMENLLPRGGGAFLAEVDGNLAGIYDAGTKVIEVTTHGKFRGPEFKPFAFKLVSGKSDKLVDTKGRHVWTITAQPISDDEQEEITKAGDHNQDELLRAMFDHPGLSIRELAEKLHWFTVNNDPNKNFVQRMLKKLHKAKLVEQDHKGQYTLTPKGQEVAEDLPPNHYVLVTPLGNEIHSREPFDEKTKERLIAQEEKEKREEKAKKQAH